MAVDPAVGATIRSFLYGNPDPLAFATQIRAARASSAPATAVAPASAVVQTRPKPAPAPASSAKPGSPVLHSTGLVQGTHDTTGLTGFPAKDYGAKAGSAVVAPVGGVVYKLSGQSTASGPRGPGKAFGYSLYIRGTDGREYFLTHLGSYNVHVGEKLTQGQHIGTVADFEKYGVPDHIHMGVHG